MDANRHGPVWQRNAAVQHAEVDRRRQQVGDIETEPEGLAHRPEG
jgi:hypothetical protein